VVGEFQNVRHLPQCSGKQTPRRCHEFEANDLYCWIRTHLCGPRRSCQSTGRMSSLPHVKDLHLLLLPDHRRYLRSGTTALPLGCPCTGSSRVWPLCSSLLSPRNGSVEHAITGNTVKGTKTVCKQAHIALRAMKKHPRILNRTKSKKRSHYLGQLPSNRSNAKEKASRSDRCRLGGPCERWLSIINVRGSSRGR
jgi:hypothetical protein